MRTIPDSENPTEAAEQVAAVLDLVIELLCKGQPEESIELHPKAITGLTYLLLVASTHLEDLSVVARHMEKEIDRFLDEAGVHGPGAEDHVERSSGKSG